MNLIDLNILKISNGFKITVGHRRNIFCNMCETTFSKTSHKSLHGRTLCFHCGSIIENKKKIDNSFVLRQGTCHAYYYKYLTFVYYNIISSSNVQHQRYDSLHMETFTS